MAHNLLNFPKQKLPLSKKNTTWKENCVDSAIAYTNIYDTSRRSPRFRKLRNYNLYNGKFDKEDLAYVCNPLGSKISLNVSPSSLYQLREAPIFQFLRVRLLLQYRARVPKVPSSTFNSSLVSVMMLITPLYALDP